MEPFEVDFIMDVFGPLDEYGLRTVRQAILSIARKNGKTALIACLVLVFLDGPLQELNGEIYSAANEREQAAQVFKYVRQIIELDDELSENLRIVESTKTVIDDASGTTYKAISADAGSKHGMNPTVVIYDELAQAKKRDLFDALDTSFGAREQPLMIIISTQSADPTHILSELIDDGLGKHDESIVAHLYAVPDDCENIYDEEIWPMANPALGVFRSLADMRLKAKKAKRLPSFETAFRNLYLNQRIDAKNPLISRAEWMACKDESCELVDGEKIYLGLDLSATTDLCALAAISATDESRCKCWFWKPGDLLKEHEKRDRVPYSLWKSQELLFAPPGRAIDYGHIALFLGELMSRYNILGIAYDRWRIELLLRELSRYGIDAWVDGKDKKIVNGLRLVPWGQGFKDMAPAIDALENYIVERKFLHDGDPVLTWNISNAMAVTDPAGNRKLDKSKSRFRIDGAIAVTIVSGLKSIEIEQPIKTIQMPVS